MSPVSTSVNLYHACQSFLLQIFRGSYNNSLLLHRHMACQFWYFGLTRDHFFLALHYLILNFHVNLSELFCTRLNKQQNFMKRIDNIYTPFTMLRIIMHQHWIWNNKKRLAIFKLLSFNIFSRQFCLKECLTDVWF